MFTLGAAEGEGEGFEAPSISEFFPGELLFEGTPFALTRVNLIGLFMTGVLCLLFVLAFRKPQIVPRGLQNLAEVAVDFVRFQIVDEVMGVQGRKYTPYLATLFFMILFWNISGIIPGMNLAATSVIGVPLFLALTSYVVFNVAGIRAQGAAGYFKSNLFPPGVPKPIYLLLTPIEAISTFVLRPFTLTVRLLANMMAGHLMLVLFFSGAWYLLVLSGQPLLWPVGIISFGAGFAFTLFEIIVSLLQAYIFTLLTAVYISGATSEHH
jgi:F-type H+-transporting ATPase subunit a